MKLTEVGTIIGAGTEHLTGDAEITGLCHDSRQVRPGTLFFALRGSAVDGHRFIPAAVAAGAVAVVLEDEAVAPAGLSWIKVPDSRRAMALTASAYYGFPSNNLKMVAVTGTNGKTTTTYLVEAIMTAAGIATGVMGTVAYRFGDRLIPAPHTTPESLELQQTLQAMLVDGARGVALEVSSHALEQHRIDGCLLDVAIFTNLTPEHLDYHGTMEEYYRAKARLFQELTPSGYGKPGARAVINLDDSYGARLAADSRAPVITCGLAEGAMVTARELDFSVDGISGVLSTPLGDAPFTSPLVGRFNLANLLGAVGAAVALGIPLDVICKGIEAAGRVPGRLERVENDCGLTVLVDYAHTGDALENVLKTIREVATGRLITVFGCGGDRDRSKRPVMGALAVRYSDLAVVTSDNPRTEDPAFIIAEVCAGITPQGVRRYSPEEVADGFHEPGYLVLEGRREAIRTAIGAAAPGDVILIAGKGHEDYQIIGSTRHHFDDCEEAAAACLAKGKRT